MNILIVINLIVFTLSQFAIIHFLKKRLAVEEFYQLQRNDLTKENRYLEDEIIRLKKSLQENEATLIRLSKKGVSDTAFLICNEGVKAVPKNWRSVWDKIST